VGGIGEGGAPRTPGSGAPAVGAARAPAQTPQSRQMGALLVELAWSWLRYQSESALAQWYGRRFAHGGKRLRRIGIVALARRLLIALWRYVEHGVIPEGAKLKAA